MRPSSDDVLSPALEELVDRFVGLVQRIGARYRVRPHEVDELLQEVRVRLWQSRSTREQIRATPASYVYRVATTAALDLLRRRRARPAESLDDDASRERILAHGESSDARLDATELESLVSRSIEEITLSRRLVVRLYLSGYDREEVAELMGWSEAKVRNLLYRGLAELRERLSARGVHAGGPT